MRFWIVDAETNTKNKGEGAIGDMPANPFHLDNRVVLWGERNSGNNRIIDMTRVTRDWLECPAFLTYARAHPVLLVGHNIAFDLKYVMKTWAADWQHARQNVYIWDTQQVKYLLSGQTEMYPSLDKCCAEIGFELKDEKIKQYWNDGIETEDIPRHELKEYLEHDLVATEAVFRHQYDIVSNNDKMFNLVKVKMDDILATNEMEYNGMEFDLVTAHELATTNDGYIAAIVASVTAFQGSEIPDFNPLSNEHVSLAMFGGTIKGREQRPMLDEAGNQVVFKTGPNKGQPKFKWHETTWPVKGMGLKPIDPPNAKGFYPVGEDVLNSYSNAFCELILNLRQRTKENETYYRGYSKLCWQDGKIHGSIGHVGTRTGRNNHTKPNLGNVTREE